MSVASEITRIQNAKNDLKTAINAKTDSEHQITDETIDEYADFVDSITGSNNVLVDCNYASLYAYTKGITSLITSIDVIDLKDLTNLRGFLATSKITTFPLLDTTKVTIMREMFMDCPLLENVPILDTSKVTTMQNMFAGYTRVLSDTSLDNILQMCIGTTSEYTRTKALSDLGFGATYYPASRIQALPHYQDFIDAGWTIGY